ncbi:MAG: glycosyltransferase family 4 protein [Bacteroidales bacterium]|nr:glycosyltransferase family 4 protein [Bacteroidales bacterium]
MKVVNIVPGFGGTFYCGNCLRDSAYVKSLKAEGHEAITLPLYLPLTSKDYTSENDIPVFYGAVNIYLGQNFRLFRRMPKWLHNFFNSPFILRYAAKKSGSTRAAGLEEMTISMLKGADGFQKDELDELIYFLKHHEKPDVVHLSNALLLGLARKIKDELQIPVVCSLQDEDVWVDAMDEPYRSRIWKLMGEKAFDTDALIAVSDFFAKQMKQKMSIPNEMLHVVHIGVDPSKYSVKVPNLDVPTIGYLSRLNKENGFEILVDAFIRLKENPKFSNARLKVTGGKTGDDDKFISRQVDKLKREGFQNDIEFIEDFRTESLGNFFEGLTLLSVPVLEGEAFGLYQIESLASGIPLVQPRLGAFPEIIEASGGGVIYQPNTSEALAQKLAEVLSDSEQIKLMSINGRKSVEEKFNTSILIQRMIEVYMSVVNKN